MVRVTILVLFDFSKAFDTVSHSKLFIKLRGLGFSDIVLSWVHSYLTGRSQPVVQGGRGGVDAQVGWILLRECPRVQFWVPSHSRCSSMILVPLLHFLNI